MSVNCILFLLTTILLLGQIPKTGGDLYAGAYEDLGDENNTNKGLKHTIHSLKGHYKEEAKILLRCGSIDKKEKEIHLTTIPSETQDKVATTEKLIITEKTSTTQSASTTESASRTEKTSTTENAITAENSDRTENEGRTENESRTENASETEKAETTENTSDELKTTENPPAMTQSRTEETVTAENVRTLLLPTSENLDEPKNNTTVNDTEILDLQQADLKALLEILQDLQNDSLPSRRLNDEDPIINTNTETDSHPALEVNQDTVLDSTQKHFEFESFVIKNEADKDITNRMHHFDQDRNAVFNIEQNNTRRDIPSIFYEGQFPINHYNPFANPIPRSYVAPTSPNIYKVEGNNSNKLNQYNPISNNQIEKILTRNHSTFNSSEYRDSNKVEQVDESDTELLFKDPYISDEDLNRVASHPTKGFGISDMDKSNLMLIEHPRVCYACSSTNNPSCWSPDIRTPAKYCRKGHNACVAKTYKHRGYAFIVRDCGTACINKGLGDLGLHYRSCTICHSDLCNGTHSASFSLKTIIVLLFTIWFKYT